MRWYIAGEEIGSALTLQGFHNFISIDMEGVSDTLLVTCRILILPAQMDS